MVDIYQVNFNIQPDLTNSPCVFLSLEDNSAKTTKRSSGILIVAITVPVAVVTSATCLVAILILSFCKQVQSSKNPRVSALIILYVCVYVSLCVIIRFINP